MIDLLPDRTAETLATWLRQHPEVEIVSRDRGGAYAEGARHGAPQATQVADRFHLLKNVTDSLERFLARNHARLRHAAQAVGGAVEEPPTTSQDVIADPSPSPPLRPRRLTRHAQAHRECRDRRLARYEEVLSLHAQGQSLRAIARHMGLSPTTVRRYVHAEGFPECQPRRRRSPLLEPFVAYLRERWDAGCHNAKALWRELRQRGYRGGYMRVSDDLRAWRPAPGPAVGLRSAGCAAPPRSVPTYTSRQTLWLLLRPPQTLAGDEAAYLGALYHACPHVYLAQALVQEFVTVVREHDVSGL